MTVLTRDDILAIKTALRLINTQIRADYEKLISRNIEDLIAILESLSEQQNTVLVALDEDKVPILELVVNGKHETTV